LPVSQKRSHLVLFSCPCATTTIAARAGIKSASRRQSLRNFGCSEPGRLLPLVSGSAFLLLDALDLLDRQDVNVVDRRRKGADPEYDMMAINEIKALPIAPVAKKRQ
jgi:hypothetical protein